MTRNKLFLILVFTLLLSACNLGAAAPVTAVPGQMETEVARQVAEQLTQVALTLPTATSLPSATPPPTETALPPTQVPPTEAPATATLPPPTATSTLPPATATPKPLPTATPQPFACQVTKQNPANGKNFKPGADFDVIWTVKNIGTAFWNNDEADYRYQSGDKFYQIEVYDLPKRVNPGESVDLLVDMKAPDKEGKYKTSWVLRQGSNVLCTLSLEINVKK